MLILFNWRSIARAAKNDPKRILLALRVLNGEKPKNTYDPLYFFYMKDLSGNSFLINLKELLENDCFYTAKEIAEYVALASFRNYSTYATTNDATLDLLHSPVSEVTITNNRLLSIENGKILFKFEEVTRRI